MEEEQQQLPIDTDDLHLVEDANPGTAGACPSCGHETWYVVQGPGMVLPVLPIGTPEGGILIRNGHALVVLACQRCGHVKSHIKALFDGYVKQLKDEADDGN